MKQVKRVVPWIGAREKWRRSKFWEHGPPVPPSPITSATKQSHCKSSFVECSTVPSDCKTSGQANWLDLLIMRNGPRQQAKCRGTKYLQNISLYSAFKSNDLCVRARELPCQIRMRVTERTASVKYQHTPNNQILRRGRPWRDENYSAMFFLLWQK